MSHATPDREAITTAQDLTGALNGVRAELRSLRKRSVVNRWIAAVAIIAALLAGWNTFRVSRIADQAAAASSSAHQNRVSNVSACRASNVTRHKEILIWTHLAAITKPAPGLSRTQLTQRNVAIAAFLAYVRQTFAARDCVRIYGKP